MPVCSGRSRRIYSPRLGALTAAIMFSGLLLIAVAALSLSWHAGWARWISAAIGAVVMAAPFVLWTGNSTAYLSDTLVGMLIFGFAVGTKPEVGPSAMARVNGPEVPPGWSYNPSSWTQRIPIISPIPMSAHAATAGSMSPISPAALAAVRPWM